MQYRFEAFNSFNSTSRYLDDLLNIDTLFDSMVNPWELQFNKANVSNTEASFRTFSTYSPVLARGS